MSYSYLTAALNQNIVYRNQLIKALCLAVNKRKEFIFAESQQSVWIDESKSNHYLFYKNGFNLTICKQEKTSYSSKNPFGFHIEQIKSKEYFLPETILQVFLVGQDVVNVSQGVEGLIEKEDEYKKLLLEMYGDMQITQSSSMSKHIMDFNNYLFEKELVEQVIPESLILQCGEIVAKSNWLSAQSKEVTSKLVELRKLTIQLGHFTKNKLIFNDGDNAVWIPKLENGICFRSQGISFIAVSRNNDWQICSFEKDSHNSKSEKKILTMLIEGTIGLEDRVLLVQDNDPIYLGDYWECMVMDLDYALEEITSIMSENEQ